MFFLGRHCAFLQGFSAQVVILCVCNWHRNCGTPLGQSARVVTCFPQTLLQCGPLPLLIRLPFCVNPIRLVVEWQAAYPSL